MNPYTDVDIFAQSSIELPKVIKAANCVVDVKYELRNLKSYISDNIADVEGELVMNTLYKAVDHTIRWNEQIIPVRAHKILDFHYEPAYVGGECIDIRKVAENIETPNIYNIQIHICMRLSLPKHNKVNRINNDPYEIDEDIIHFFKETEQQDEVIHLPKETYQPKKDTSPIKSTKKGRSKKHKVLSEILRAKEQISCSSDDEFMVLLAKALKDN